MAQWFWESYQFSRNVRQCHNFEKLNARASRSVKWSEDPVQMRQAPRAFLGSPHRIHTSLHLVWGKMSLHSSHCREIRPSFESGHLGIHSTWGIKLRVPLTYILLREGCTWGDCGKLAYLCNRILEVHSLLEMIWCPWSFPRVPVLKLVFL